MQQVPSQSVLQQKVLSACMQRAKEQSDSSQGDLVKVVNRLKFSLDDLAQVKTYLSKRTEITINFAPSKKLTDGSLLIDVLVTSDHYQNAFEIGFSSGASATIDPNNSRNRIEKKLFEYPEFSQSPTLQEKSDRPKYCALNIFTYGTGGASGSSYGESALVVRPEIKAVTTLTNKDSFAIDTANEVGTFDDYDHLLVALHTAKKRERVDFDGLDEQAAVRVADVWFKAWLDEVLSQATFRRQATQNNRSYWEVQVHATIQIPTDISYLRASFQRDFDANTREKLVRWCERNNWPLVWAWDRDQMLLQPTNDMLGETQQLYAYLAPFLDTWISIENQTTRKRTDWTAIWDKAPPSLRYTPESAQAPAPPKQSIGATISRILRK